MCMIDCSILFHGYVGHWDWNFFVIFSICSSEIYIDLSSSSLVGFPIVSNTLLTPSREFFTFIWYFLILWFQFSSFIKKVFIVVRSIHNITYYFNYVKYTNWILFYCLHFLLRVSACTRYDDILLYVLGNIYSSCLKVLVYIISKSILLPAFFYECWVTFSYLFTSLLFL